MPTTTSYYSLEIALNKHRQLQPSEIHNLPYYVFQMYYESVKEELKAKKKANDEQVKEQSKSKSKFKIPKFRK